MTIETLSTPSCRVLLVEDDPGDANLVRQWLRLAEGEPFDVTWVTTLADARQQLRDQPPDILLLDLSLPDSRGIATVQAGRAAADTLPLVVLTGHDDPSFALQTLEAGAQDYLIKGKFDTDNLVRAIRYAISRARLEQRLSETGMHLRTLINAMPDFICFKDGEGRWLEANDFGLKMFCLDQVDYHGKTDAELAKESDFYHDAFLACVDSDEAAWNVGGISQLEEAVLMPNGTTLAFDVTKIPLFHEDGRRKGLVVVGRDITERKRNEARQRLASRVFDTTGEAIMVTDVEANIVAVNPAFTLITGYSEQEVLGKNPRILQSDRHDRRFHEMMWGTLLDSGQWAGEVWNRRKNGEIYPEWQTVSSVRDEAGRVTHYVAVFADLSEIRRAQQTAEHLSWHDSLTGLANRALFIHELEQVLASVRRDGHYTDVLLLDLDRFKDINEARGLAVGDALLIAVAARLKLMLNPDDILARLDSDEFAVLLGNPVPNREAAGRLALATAEKLRAALMDAIELKGEAFHVNASVGIAMLPESPQETAADVLRQADLAMHQAKAEGGGCAVFFETTMGEAVRERYQLERELRQAIDGNELRLYLQPQVDVDARQVGAESLIRWQHPSRGLLPPGVFIPLAESSDLIVEVDRWMLAQVCRLLAALDRDGRTLRISVNISPRHFNRPDFVEEVKRHLAASGADPTHLVLEITEGLVIANVADVVTKMTALAALGIHFSMDDFGTGYSSLAYLKRLPIHELKIDKSFIQDVTTDLNDAALVETILAVAQHLHLQVVAEGVETAAQAEFLNARGKVIHQGYFFGRPEPVDTWLAKLDGAGR